MPIVSAATAFTFQESGLTNILIIHEGLWFGGRLLNSLINPNQLHFNGVTVHDNPAFDPGEPIGIDTPELRIPLSMTGTIIFFHSSNLTALKLDSCPRIHLTSDAEWNPHTLRLAFARTVEVGVKVTGNIFDGNLGDLDSHETEIGLAQISATYSFREMADAVAQERIIGAANSFVSQKQHPQVTKEQLSER